MNIYLVLILALGFGIPVFLALHKREYKIYNHLNLKSIAIKGPFDFFIFFMSLLGFPFYLFLTHELIQEYFDLEKLLNPFREIKPRVLSIVVMFFVWLVSGLLLYVPAFLSIGLLLIPLRLFPGNEVLFLTIYFSINYLAGIFWGYKLRYWNSNILIKKGYILLKSIRANNKNDALAKFKNQ